MCPVVDGSSILNFAAIPSGIYEAKLESWENKEAKTDQSANANLTFVITEPVTNVEGKEVEGVKQFLTRNLKPQSLWSFKNTCVALGADPSLFDGEFDTDEILTDLVGAPCRIKVVLNPEGHEYAGKNNIEDVLAPTISAGRGRGR